jgi:hypothetical protein
VNPINARIHPGSAPVSGSARGSAPFVSTAHAEGAEGTARGRGERPWEPGSRFCYRRHLGVRSPPPRRRGARRTQRTARERGGCCTVSHCAPAAGRKRGTAPAVKVLPTGAGLQPSEQFPLQRPLVRDLALATSRPLEISPYGFPPRSLCSSPRPPRAQLERDEPSPRDEPASHNRPSHNRPSHNRPSHSFTTIPDPDPPRWRSD